MEKGLKADALGLVSSVVIAIASVAPAYSLAATFGFVVIAVGLQAPIIMVLAFIPHCHRRASTGRAPRRSRR